MHKYKHYQMYKSSTIWIWRWWILYPMIAKEPLWRRQAHHPFYWNNWVVWLGWWLLTFWHLDQSHFHGRCVWPWNRWYPNKDLNTIMKNETILLSPLHFQKSLDGLQVGPNIPIYLFIRIDWYYDHIDFTCNRKWSQSIMKMKNLYMSSWILI